MMIMSNTILFFCSLFSCAVIVNIMFQFWNDRLEKKYYHKHLYNVLPIISIVILTLVNMFMNSILNLIVNVLLFGAICSFFYYQNSSKQLIILLETEALLVIMGVVEALGVFVIDSLLDALDLIPESVEILKSIESIFSKIILLFLYYVVLRKIWVKDIIRTRMQYVLYLIVFSYNLINMLAISVISSSEKPIVLAITVAATIFVVMFLIYFMKFSDERNYYKLRSEMMEQQIKIQLKQYESQSEKYRESMSILHDVDKHIKMIEGLNAKGFKEEAKNYTTKIKSLLQPLLPIRYTDNMILNCLLADKVREAKNLDISFTIDISMIDINFMDEMDITVLFGNLIDNAVVACTKCHDNPYIQLYANSFHDMVSLTIENSFNDDILVRDGKLIHRNQRGIGLSNIRRTIDKYDGSLIYKIKKNVICCNIILNRGD